MKISLLSKVLAYAVIASPLVLGYLLICDFFPDNLLGSAESIDVAPSEYSTDYAPTAEKSDSQQQAPQYVIIDTTPQQSVWNNQPGGKKSNQNKLALYPWQPSSKSDTANSNVDATQQQ